MSGLVSFQVTDLNVRSLGVRANGDQMEASRFSKIDTLLRSYIAKNDRFPFIAFLQETWLDPTIDYKHSPTPLVPEGYATLLAIERIPWDKSRGGG